MTDIEINKALALAIGWRSDQFIEYEGQSYIGLPVIFNGPGIKLFDYRFTSVIWPIAERYNAFPNNICPDWECLRYIEAWGWVRYTADTAAKAVAIAVIGRKP